MLPVRLTHRPFGGSLLAWDPFRVFGRGGRCLQPGTNDGPETLADGFEVDVREDEHCYTIEANLPGVDKDAVELTFDDGVLTIKAENRGEDQRDEDSFHIRERYVGAVSRSFRLPAEADPEKVSAKLADGVLTVTVEKAEADKPRKITVQAG